MHSAVECVPSASVLSVAFLPLSSSVSPLGWALPEGRTAFQGSKPMLRHVC